MKHLCKLTSWAAIMLAVATLSSCTKEQSELSIDDIVKLCDALIKAHGNMLPRYR